MGNPLSAKQLRQRKMEQERQKRAEEHTKERKERAQEKEKQAAWKAKMKQERTEEKKKHAAWKAKMKQERTEEKKKQAAWKAKVKQERTEEKKKQAAWKAKMERERKEREEKHAKEHAEDQKKQAAWEARMERERQEREERRAETLESFEHLRKRIGGMGNRVGAAIEDFFAFAIESAMPFSIQGIRFDKFFFMTQSDEEMPFAMVLKEMQCPIVLVNKEYIAIVEIEPFLMTDDIIAFDRKLRSVLPHALPKRYRHLRVVPVMACMDLSTYAPREVRKHGIAVMRPDGEGAELDTQHLRIRELTSAP